MFFGGLLPVPLYLIPQPRQAEGLSPLGAGCLRSHSGQGVSLSEAAKGREGTDWALGCHTFDEKVFSRRTVSNSSHPRESLGDNGVNTGVLVACRRPGSPRGVDDQQSPVQPLHSTSSKVKLREIKQIA